MFTQCPQCETVFKLSADVLRAAAGQVRCGRCGAVFNALSRLSEDVSAFLDKKTALELETRADSILESVVALKLAEAVAEDEGDFGPPGKEVARLEVLGYWAEEDRDGEPLPAHPMRRAGDIVRRAETETSAEEAAASATDDPRDDIDAALDDLAAQRRPTGAADEAVEGHDEAGIASHEALDESDDFAPELRDEVGELSPGLRDQADDRLPGLRGEADDLAPKPREGQDEAAPELLDETEDGTPELLHEAEDGAPQRLDEADDPASRSGDDTPLFEPEPGASPDEDAPVMDFSDEIETTRRELAEGLIPLDVLLEEDTPPRFEPEPDTLETHARTDVRESDIFPAEPVDLDELGQGTEDSDPTAQTDEVQALDEASLEFTLPPGELDRIFVESAPIYLKRPESSDDDAGNTVADAQSAGIAADSTRAEPPPHPESAAPRERRAPRLVGAEISDTLRREILEGLQPTSEPREALDALSPETRPPASRRRRFVWASAAVLLALLLVAQAAHRNPDWLSAHAEGPFGAAIRTLSGAMGTPLAPAANLAAFEVRQWGVSGEPEANGVLRLRASILNTAAQLQPFPLLRVTLADRFGKRIGTRDFEPAEYLGKPIARLLSPGERADVVLDIVDPGKNAEDFEIDVCMRGTGRVHCASDAATRPKP